MHLQLNPFYTPNGSIPLPWHRCAQIFLEYSIHKILGAKRETWSKLRTAVQNILGANIDSSVATIRAPLFQDCQACANTNSRWGIQLVLSQACANTNSRWGIQHVLSQACANTNSTWVIQHVLSPDIVKVKFTLEQVTKAQSGSRGTALLFP